MLFIIEEAHYFLLLYKTTHCNILKVKLSNSQLNKSKSGLKNGNEVTLKI